MMDNLARLCFLSGIKYALKCSPEAFRVNLAIKGNFTDPERKLLY